MIEIRPVYEFTSNIKVHYHSGETDYSKWELEINGQRISVDRETATQILVSVLPEKDLCYSVNETKKDGGFYSPNYPESRN